MEHKYYTLENKPNFIQDQKVNVDFGKFGIDYNQTLSGVIMGLSSNNVIDFWIVDFGVKLSNIITGCSYEYSSLAVPHTFILDEN